MTKTMSFPALSGRFAISMAACAAEPEEMPPRIPSSFARRRAIANDSSFETWKVSSTNAMSRFFGMNPAPRPWILWGPGAPPEITAELAGRRKACLEPEGEREADDVRFRHVEKRRPDREAPALGAGLRPELRDALERLEECGAAVGVAGVIESVCTDDDLRRPVRLGDAERERQKKRIASGDVRDGDARLSERLLRNPDRAVGQCRAAERAEGRDRDHAMRGDAVLPSECARRRQLDAVPLTVIERKCVHRPAPAGDERETRRAVEAAGEQNHRCPSAPNRCMGNRYEMRRFSQKVNASAVTGARLAARASRPRSLCHSKKSLS